MRIPTSDSGCSGEGNVCGNAEQRGMLLPYAFLGCNEDQEVAFEAHLLECTCCFEDLRTLDRAAELIEEMETPEVGLRAVLRRARSSGSVWRPGASRFGADAPSAASNVPGAEPHA